MLLGDSYTMVRYLKRLKSSRLGRVQAFPMYGGLGMSAPSLHRELESTDSRHALLRMRARGRDACTCAVRSSRVGWMRLHAQRQRIQSHG